jgi:hypothetical protein
MTVKSILRKTEMIYFFFFAAFFFIAFFFAAIIDHPLTAQTRPAPE